MKRAEDRIKLIRHAPWSTQVKGEMAAMMATSKWIHGIEQSTPTQSIRNHDMTQLNSLLMKGRGTWISRQILYAMGHKGHLLHPDMVIAYQQLKTARRQLTKNPALRADYVRVYHPSDTQGTKAIRPGVVHKLRQS